MFESRALRFAVCLFVGTLASEAVYLGYCLLRERKRALDEVSEVVWTNELTQTCSIRHFKESKKIIERADSSSDDDLESSLNKSVVICHNPFCVKKNIGRLANVLRNAQYSIDVAIYTFTSLELSKAILSAMERGVVVRIISDKEMVYSSGSQITSLTSAGAGVRSPQTVMLMHHKFCVIDGPKRAQTLQQSKKSRYNSGVKGIVITGSLNWTMQGLSGNWENALITSNREFVKKYETEFERMWVNMSLKQEGELNSNSNFE